MQPSRRAPIDAQLADLAQRSRQLHGELSEQAEEIAARAQAGRPATIRRQARIEQLRAAYLAVQQGRERLQAGHPPEPEADTDF